MVLVLLTWHILAIAVSSKAVALSEPENMWGLLFVLLWQELTTAYLMRGC